MCHFFFLTVFWLKLWSILEQIYGTMESICKLQQRVWMSHTWFTCFPPNNFGLLQVSWSLIKELRKKRKKCNTQSFLCTCTFCPEKEIQTSINFRTTLCTMYFKWDETLIPNASFVDHSEKLWKKRDVLP